MPNRSLTRRRMITIVATAAGSAFLTGGRTAQAGDAVRWQGSALGAQVSIEIYHPDRAEAERLVEQSIQDVRRLEQQFSLYRANSAICSLNRSGILVSPDADMVALLKASLFFGDLTDGAFDPTVQPLWQLYADHFASARPDPEGPSPQEAGGNAGESGPQRPACERRPNRADQTRRGNHAERHRPGLRHRPRRRQAAQSGPVDDAGRYGRDTGDRSAARGHAVAGGPRRSRQARRAHRNHRPRRSCRLDIGRRRIPVRLQRPVYASVRSSDRTQPVAVQHRERHCANGHRSGCAFHRIQPDAVVADPATSCLSDQMCRRA